MNRDLRANLWLLVLSVVLCSVLYPGLLLVIGRTVFPNKAEGSLLLDGNKVIRGSRLIGQPFAGEQYFQPRPSAASYNAAAASGSNWGANNFLLRDRVARVLGPIVKYQSGPKRGQPVGPDVESWFQQDQYQGQPGIVAQWAGAHSTLAQNWAKTDDSTKEYVTAWQKGHPDDVTKWMKDNPDNTEPKPEDLAVVFLTSFSKEHPGTFPSAVEHEKPDGSKEKTIEPVKEGSDIQAIFFDMWLQEHPSVDLEPVPADMVMASGSGLDPHITRKNADYQLDRIAAAWADKSNPKRDAAQVRKEIKELLNQKAEAPLGGLVGVELVNVLVVNLALRDRYESGGEKTASSEPGKPGEGAGTGTKGTPASEEKTPASTEGRKTDTTSVAIKENAPKSKEKVEPAAEPSQPSSIAKVNGTPPKEAKTPVEPDKSSKVAIANGKEKPADKAQPAKEPVKASATGAVANEPASKSAGAGKSSVELTEPKLPGVNEAASAKPTAAAPSDEKKQAAAVPDKSSKVVVTSGKEKPADKLAAEPSKAAPSKTTAEPQPSKSAVTSGKEKPADKLAAEPSGAAPSRTPVEPQVADSTPPKVSDNADVATIVVRVPADAKLYFDERPTEQTGSERTFVTPTLGRGKQFHYNLRTEVVSRGNVISRTKRVAVRAGETTVVEMGVEPVPATK